MPESRKKQYLRGMKAGIPVIFGFIPVGIAYAIMARQAGFSVLQTCGMSLLVYAGASQMMAAGMYAQGASVIAMIIATFLLNFRHFIMSTCVMNRIKGESMALRLAASFGVTDESFAIFSSEKEEHCTGAFFLGLITVAYASWNVGTLIGAVLSDILPAVVTASLGIALYAMFIGILVPSLRGNLRLFVLVAATAVCSFVLNLFMESSRALIISTLVCAFAGVFFVDLGEENEDEKH